VNFAVLFGAGLAQTDIMVNMSVVKSGNDEESPAGIIVSDNLLVVSLAKLSLSTIHSGLLGVCLLTGVSESQQLDIESCILQAETH